ncbi:MAG: hypothetical protein ACREDZ_17430 [Kiloniellales bacterium]
MGLKIETFSNAKGGNAFFKALGHPLAARRTADWLTRLADGPVALYDPDGYLAALAELYDLSALEIAGVYVQDLEALGTRILGHAAQPVTALAEAKAERVLVAAFDAQRLIEQIAHLVPAGAEIESLDALRLPDDMLTDKRRYLSGLNFATNFAFFREGDGRHTRLVTANYWSAYGARDPEFWCCLFDQDGNTLAEWRDGLPAANGTLAIDSAEIARRFGLESFTGQLFVHALKIVGHDVVKYALDTYGERDDELSCTHDANAWPAELYAGLPAPDDGEKVILWVQNSHPSPIAKGEIGMNLMGHDNVVRLEREIAPFASYPLDTAALLPDARWPQQIEIQAGKHFVRPRYEVVKPDGRRRIAHPNVERVDLKPDPRIPELSNLLGKGYLLPAPVLPTARFRSLLLPTPMATTQANLPVAVKLYDPAGRELAEERLGKLPRNHAREVDLGALFAQATNGKGAANGEALDGKWTANGAGPWGHAELIYDFAEGGEADGWLHGLFRYHDRKSGHAAETSFGAHIFNAVLTYKGEPQSYAGRPPGLSTRLFLRLGKAPYDTLCHLIYPASTPWKAESSTQLILTDGQGRAVAERAVAIACGGSLLWRVSETFEAGELKAAGAAEGTAYVLIRDTGCRLFGYHGLLRDESAFSLDHMFGF